MNTYKHIFGPVPSRRLGTSLGIDLMPHKTCTLNCVYCECGPTTRLTIKRKPYVPVESVKKELRQVLSCNPHLDYITFSGSGEPTLHSGIGEIINFLNSEFPAYKVALLTNGTLLFQPKVQEALLALDLVVASLDAATENTFNMINRPHRFLDLSLTIESFALFKKIFKHEFWIEVFIVPGINDTKHELDKIKYALSVIKPDKVQLNSIDRPGAEAWVEPVCPTSLESIATHLNNAEIIRHPSPDTESKCLSVDYNAVIMSTLKRRPCTTKDISRILGIDDSEADQVLDKLVHSGEIEKKIMPRGIFYKLNI